MISTANFSRVAENIMVSVEEAAYDEGDQWLINELDRRFLDTLEDAVFAAGMVNRAVRPSRATRDAALKATLEGKEHPFLVREKKLIRRHLSPAALRIMKGYTLSRIRNLASRLRQFESQYISGDALATELLPMLEEREILEGVVNILDMRNMAHKELEALDAVGRPIMEDIPPKFPPSELLFRAFTISIDGWWIRPASPEWRAQYAGWNWQLLSNQPDVLILTWEPEEPGAGREFYVHEKDGLRRLDWAEKTRIYSRNRTLNGYGGVKHRPTGCEEALILALHLHGE